VCSIHVVHQDVKGINSPESRAICRLVNWEDRLLPNDYIGCVLGLTLLWMLSARDRWLGHINGWP